MTILRVSKLGLYRGVSDTKKHRVALGEQNLKPLLAEMHRWKCTISAHHSILPPVLGTDTKAQESHCPSADTSSLQEMVANLKYWS